jgi:hypothetical protein
MPPKNFIAKAIKHPGALKALAEKEGAITRSGTISKTWLKAKSKEAGPVGKRARLAITLGKLG